MLEVVPEAVYAILSFLFVCLFDFFFLLVALIGCCLLPYVPNHCFDSWLHPLYLLPCNLSFISISISFISELIYFMLLRFSLSSSSILVTCVLNSASEIAYLHFV